ncbi:3-oxoacyl-[acyl-carrier-protein] reductase [candidate division KSB1 bacterium]|nr:3-oxoacyl-[acyl-carrier-protein] reductase [candidate division KSB1 bacterium]RQW07321.1 MAG: 3-oxoacyl-[acyl-carrier-protein] reductase [candidate division KSB1 bacterium]
MNLTGQIAIVTGAARGIGAAIAFKLARAGCDLVISDIDAPGASAIAEKIKEMGQDAIAMQADVSTWSQAELLLKESVAKFAKVDILVNNAGITRDNLLMRMSDAEWDSVMAVNLKGTFNCIKAAARTMMKQRRGKIINIASVVGVIGNAGQANYAASKAGIIGLTKSVAKEFGARNIQVNAIAPGYIQTDMTKDLPDSAKEAFLTIIPLQRAGQTEDVANAVLFLVSPLSDYITGQVLHVDGGMVM